MVVLCCVGWFVDGMCQEKLDHHCEQTNGQTDNKHKSSEEQKANVPDQKTRPQTSDQTTRTQTKKPFAV